MNKYPYTFEEFKKTAEEQFLRDYYKNNRKEGLEVLKDKDIQEALEEGYKGRKYDCENDLSYALDNIKNEVQGTTYCMFMFI